MNRLLAVLVFSAVAAHAETAGDWQYSVSDGEATITGYTGTGGAVTMPGEVGGVLVRKIADYAFRSNSTLVSILTPNGLRQIGWGAFANCSALESVTIAPTVQTIGPGAFDGSKIRAMDIPDSVTNFTHANFANCAFLQKVRLSENLSEIGGDTFLNCSSLSYLIIPEKVTNISSRAFDGSSPRIYFSGNQPDNLQRNFAGGLYNFTGTGFYPSDNPTWAGFQDNAFSAYDAGSDQDGDQLNIQTEIFFQSDPDTPETNSPVPGLYLTSQYQANWTNGRTAGRFEVTSAPNSFGLYTSNQIQNLGLGGIMLNRNTNNQLVLNYQILQSTDLQNWSSYQQNQLVLSNAPSDKMFLRLQAVENNSAVTNLGNLPGGSEGSSDTGPTNPGGAGDGGTTGSGGSLGGD